MTPQRNPLAAAEEPAGGGRGERPEHSDATKIDHERDVESTTGSFHGQNPGDSATDAPEEIAGDAIDEALGTELEASGETPGDWFDAGGDAGDSGSDAAEAGES